MPHSYLWTFPLVLLLAPLLQSVTCAAEPAPSAVAHVNVPGTWDAPSDDDALSSGFGWYRCYVKVPNRWTNYEGRSLWVESVVLTVEHLADAYEVYLNGRKIGGGGSMPPQFAAASEEVRRFKLPPGILARDAYNVLAIRVYSEDGPGGFKGQAPVLSGYYLECKLAGEWEFFAGDDPELALAPLETPPEQAVFDQFREATSPLAQPEEFIPGRRLPVDESLASFRTVADLAVDQVLTEPTVAQPLHMSWDARGRLWVVQYRQYPFPAGLRMVSRDKYYRAVYDQVPPPPPNHTRGNDRISVHEDTDGDGQFDKHRVFADGLNIATSVACGRGGVWVLTPPHLVFYPDADGDAVPDGDPILHLTGFGLEDTHSVANSLCWGPDGWLYGAQGSTVSSRITVAGSDAQPVYCEGPAIWRYHPESQRYELFAEGGGNAFGIEIDSQGRLYSGHNGGDTRGFHYVQGSYYDKGTGGKYGAVSNLYAFGLLQSMPTDNPIPRFSHDLVKYEGAQLPERYHGRLLSIDPLHNHVILVDILPSGSSFKTSDVEVVLQSSDTGFRPVAIATGPDGAVYLADFYEEFIAHGQHFQGQLDRKSGRVYRLRDRADDAQQILNLDQKAAAELVELLRHPSKWHRRTALRLIADAQDRSVVPQLREILKSDKGQVALEALWALNLLGAFDEALAEATLHHANPHVRSWTVRLLGDQGQISQALAGRLVDLAAHEPDVEVLSQLASTARRLPADACLGIIKALLRRDADAGDPHLPSLVWWALESKAEMHREDVLALFQDRDIWQGELAAEFVIPRLMRRYATAGTRRDLLSCARLFELAPSEGERRLLIEPFEASITGRALGAVPVALAEQLLAAGGGSLSLRIRLGKTKAIDEALAAVADDGTPTAERIELVQTLADVQQPEALPVLLDLLDTTDDPDLTSAVLTALQSYAEPRIAEEVLLRYANWSKDVQQVAQSLLASRPAWAELFLDAVDRGQLAPESVMPSAVRRITVHADLANAALLEKHWPTLDTQAVQDAERQIARLTQVLGSGSGDPYAGKELFNQRCAKCHMLFGEGGSIGPELTRYARDDTSRMLLNIIRPSAEVREGFESYLVLTVDGRAASGFLVDQDKQIVVLRDADGQNVTLQHDRIDQMVRQRHSVMPSGLLDDLTDQQVRDLFACLRSGQPINR